MFRSCPVFRGSRDREAEFQGDAVPMRLPGDNLHRARSHGTVVDGLGQAAGAADPEQ